MADWFVTRLGTLKLRLATKTGPARRLVPLVEVFEVWLTDGFLEVAARVRLRLRGRAIEPSPEYIRLAAASSNDPLVIPALEEPEAVTIVIPVLDQLSLTLQCLRSIVRHTRAGSYDVIVVDNGSNEATRHGLERVAGLRVLRNETNVGFVEACNQGARAAVGSFIAFLNNDTVVLPGWLDALVDTLKRDQGAGAVGAKLLYPDGRLQEAGSIIWKDGSGWNCGKGADPEAPEFCYVREVDYCSAACLLIRRQLLQDLGWFDDRYAPAYYEDTDLCFRIRERDMTVLFQPQARVVHIEGATAGTNTSTGLKRFQDVNRAKFVERHAAALEEQFAADVRWLPLARDRRRGKRILIVDHMLPQPDHDSGSVRMWAIVRILTELGHAVTFLPDNLARSEPYATRLQQMGVEVLYGPMSPLDYVARNLERFDIVILCRANFAIKYLSTIRTGPHHPFLIFDTVDLHHLREERHAELERSAALKKSAARTRSVELSLMHASDMVWVTSTHEAEVLQRYDENLSLQLVPNIHETREEVPGFGARQHLLFIGGFRHPPNEDAVHYFVEDVLPKIIRRLPEIQLLIVGSHVPAVIERLESTHIRVLGHVSDVEPVFDACRLSIAPLRYGAGVKGKISQSLAWGVPVVTTPIGAEGMGLRDRQHALIAADADDFAEKVIELYTDEALWTELSRAGRCHVQAHLGYESVRRSLAEMIERFM